ncbi:MAG: MarR family transcriptional regulator [Pseudomonadota bacterium]
MTQARLSRLDSACWFAVVEAYQICNRRYSAMLREFDLTIPQYDVLSAIDKLGNRAQPKQIADELLVTRGNVTGLLTRLQERRLIRTRQSQSDGRSFLCELTRRGETLLNDARSAASLFITEQLAPFDDASKTEMESTMRRMQRHLEALDPIAIVMRARAAS